MKKIILLFALIPFLFSCQKEKELTVDFTGDLTIITGGATTYLGDPIKDFQVGLFDQSILNETFFSEKGALYRGYFNSSGFIQFKDVNLGNYVVAFVGTAKNHVYKTVQVKAGQSITIDLLH